MNNGLVLYAMLWFLAGLIVYTTRKWYALLIPYVFFVVNELAYVSTGFDILSSRDRTALFYDLSSWYTNYAGIDPNYSEGYYPNDNYSISSRQAEHNKFELFLKLLGAKKGDTILNLGSGTCSFERYCKDHGIHMVATSVSSQQVEFCKKYDIEAYVHDYRNFKEDFVNRFDHITFMGSCEHMHTGSVFKKSSFVQKQKILTQTFNVLKKYLKPNGRIMFTELHFNPKYTRTAGAYILERAYGGTPSLDIPELNAGSAANAAGFKVLYERDASKEYYMATVLDDKHFGTPNTPWSIASIGLFLMGFVYPPAWNILLYGLFGIWMWMFDGRTHYSFHKRYSLAPRKTRPLTLLWYVFERS